VYTIFASGRFGIDSNILNLKNCVGSIQAIIKLAKISRQREKMTLR
jgi:hypothetical protein